MSTAATATLETLKAVPGAKNVIRRFTMRRVMLGATIFGLFAAFEGVAQGYGIVAAYPNMAERAKVVYGLANNAALGLFYGDKHADIISSGGYMAYRILPILALIGAIWSLLFITKMLRGQEENGRWELLLSGQVSAAKATAKTIMGAAGGIAIAYSLSAVILILAARSSKFSLSITSCLFYSLAVIAGAAVALGVGAVTSQLAATRRQAVLYGLAIILPFFLLRSVANVVNSLAWLKNLTPFGWIEKLHPFYHSQPLWLLPLLALVILSSALAIRLAGKRDLAESIIADSDSAQPKLRLLKSQLGFDFRLTRNVMIGWLVTSVVMTALIAAIDKTVAKSLSGTTSLTKTFSNLTGNPSANFEIAYLSAASYFIVIILMIMVTSSLGAIRDEEASSRLDNFVSGTVSRKKWLSLRLALMIGGAIGITLVSNLVVWVVARAQGIPVSAATLLIGGLNILGPVVLLLGCGVLLFGLLPRLTTIGMYALLGWSFTIDIVSSALKTNKFVADTSLLHHISLVPAANPNWGTFSVLTAVGLALMGLGIIAFQRRDLEVE